MAHNPDAGRWFQAASPATVHLRVPHAQHTGAMVTEPRTWESRVISFLNAVLHPREG